ncbi:asparagine synthetase A [Sphaerisporangium sp. TRM90804]|uniref:asparagine synthetase A n=1 Tax=Sphaerisporangium sp. TRM90804 TaxID=3031113 RepID=UPI00244940EC|nr:asparagine synthetase A [Sphaerisporangium sp. TRM90804]MDH2427988.1 asparagine synthetase A [Sphaerisporangium sp. TRM90804]
MVDVSGAMPGGADGRVLPPQPWEHLTSETTRTVLRIQHHIVRSARRYLDDQGFVELLPPVIGPVTDPGIRGAKQVDVDYYGHRYKLMTSAFVYKQASLLAFDKIVYVAPNVRLEPLETCSTNRHLAEFHQLDIEVAGATREQIMELAEGVVGHVVDAVVSDMGDELAALGRDVTALSSWRSRPFARVPHAEAVRDLVEGGHMQDGGAEIDWAGEEILSIKADGPFFLTDYPKGSRCFLEKEDPDQPGVLRTFDLIMPGGYGEVISGGEREAHYPTLITRMRETGENPSKYGWYLQLSRHGVPSSSGFGLGLQRLTRFVAGLEYVWQAAAFPKVPGVVSP